MSQTHRAVLTEGPITPTLVKLTIPMIFGIFGMVAFNLVDAFFIGLLGNENESLALDALGFTIPVVLVLGAIGMGISMGASAVVSKAIGEGDRAKVQRLTVDSLFLAVIFALLFVVIGLLTMDPLFRLLGAEGEVLRLTKVYMGIWYIGVVFVIVPFVGNSCIRANGHTKTPAIIMMSMVGVNIILDPILIFGIGPLPGTGLAGAALATVIARGLSLVIGLYVLYRQNMLTLRIPGLGKAWASWRSILYVGLPAAATNLVVPLTTALITNLVAEHGNASLAGMGIIVETGTPAVGALGVAARIDLFAIMVVVALSTVMGPFVGQNLGAGKLGRLSTGVHRGERFSMLWGLGMMALIGVFAPWIAPIFTDNEAVIAVIVLYLRIVPFGYAARCVYALGNTVLNVLNKPLLASAITLVQMFVVYLPLAHWGAEEFGLIGIFGAQVLAFLVGGTASYLLVTYSLKQLPQPAPVTS